MPDLAPDSRRWYDGVTRYQWLVLAIAAAGWAFDQYETQIFVMTKDRMVAEVKQVHGAAVDEWADQLSAYFLLGSALGGLVAGSLADRYGRRPLLVATILFYSIFAGLTYFATEFWQLAIIRLFVAAGTGGEWVVGASLVAEVFPKQARPYAAGIFHGTGVLGYWTAASVSIAIGTQWRLAYLVGVLPALLTVWILTRIEEPERWQQAVKHSHQVTNERHGQFFRTAANPELAAACALGPARWRPSAWALFGP